jgi:transposase-like protein
VNDWQSIVEAARMTGVNRNSIARWVKLGLLVGRPRAVRNLVATEVSVSRVKELAKQRPPGRPKKK